ncbi:hypothetical protein FJY94_04650 [Candidatus Kaiserbacteria bacterium]|nr:hypothetical protein [Candidatus Kaiserbacteria bacterium]
MNTDTIPVQTGPVYHCFNCGAEPATFIAYFRPCGSALDPWSLYIWYLKRPCGCKGASRVVRLGDCIAPLAASSPDGLSPADIPAIQAALQAIARAVPPAQRRLDPATRIVYGLLAGSVTPHEAIAELRALVRHPAHEPAMPISAHAVKANSPSEAEAIMFLSEGAQP